MALAALLPLNTFGTLAISAHRNQAGPYSLALDRGGRFVPSSCPFVLCGKDRMKRKIRLLKNLQHLNSSSIEWRVAWQSERVSVTDGLLLIADWRARAAASITLP